MPIAKLFKMHAFTAASPSIEVDGPGELRLSIDYDDVDHTAVAYQAKRLVRLLNKHWAEPMRAGKGGRV